MENGNWKGKILLWYPHECLRGSDHQHRDVKTSQDTTSCIYWLVFDNNAWKYQNNYPTNSFFQDTWCHIAVPQFLLPLTIESRSASHPIPLHPLTRLQHNPTELNSHVSSIDCSTVYGKTSSNNSAKWPSVCFQWTHLFIYLYKYWMLNKCGKRYAVKVCT